MGYGMAVEARGDCRWEHGCGWVVRGEEEWLVAGTGMRLRLEVEGRGWWSMADGMDVEWMLNGTMNGCRMND